MKTTIIAIFFLINFCYSIKAQVTDSTKENRPIKMTTGFFGYSFTEGESKIKFKHLPEKFESNSLAYTAIIKARRNNNASNIIGFIGGFMVGFTYGSNLNGGNVNPAIAVVGSGLIVVSFPFYLNTIKYARKAVKYYNAGLGKTVQNNKPTLNFCSTKNGIGLALNF